jgi:hypothetical protein
MDSLFKFLAVRNFLLLWLSFFFEWIKSCVIYSLLREKIPISFFSSVTCRDLFPLGYDSLTSSPLLLTRNYLRFIHTAVSLFFLNDGTAHAGDLYPIKFKNSPRALIFLEEISTVIDSSTRGWKNFYSKIQNRETRRRIYKKTNFEFAIISHTILYFFFLLDAFTARVTTTWRGWQSRMTISYFHKRKEKNTTTVKRWTSEIKSCDLSASSFLFSFRNEKKNNNKLLFKK